jgi:anti-anti-sigma regulatory factor
MDPALIAGRVTGTTHVIVVRGVVDRDGGREIEYLVRHGTSDPPADVVIDLTWAEEITGALIGALLRASRRLAWRNRRLTIVCPQADLRGRLEIAGLDELADVTASLDS